MIDNMKLWIMSFQCDLLYILLFASFAQAEFVGGLSLESEWLEVFLGSPGLLPELNSAVLWMVSFLARGFQFF